MKIRGKFYYPANAWRGTMYVFRVLIASFSNYNINIESLIYVVTVDDDDDDDYAYVIMLSFIGKPSTCVFILCCIFYMTKTGVRR